MDEHIKGLVDACKGVLKWWEENKYSVTIDVDEDEHNVFEEEDWDTFEKLIEAVENINNRI